MTLAHWDDGERERREVGDLRSSWRDLGRAAGSTEVGVRRVAGTTFVARAFVRPATAGDHREGERDHGPDG